MKSRPKKACLVFSMRPNMCTPQSLQAFRRIVASASTIFSLSPLAVTLTLSRGTTATTEKTAPSGFQHLVQPQAWLCAHWLATSTVTGLLLHLQVSVPPAKLALPGLTPSSTNGWIFTLLGIALPPTLNRYVS